MGRSSAMMAVLGLVATAAVFSAAPGPLGGKARAGRGAQAGIAAQTLENAFPELRFSRPVALVAPRDGTQRLFVVEQDGRIQVFRNSAATDASKVFLDLAPIAFSPSDGGGSEEGLLGLAFDPQFRSNGELYVYYSAREPRRNVLARYRVSEDPDRAEITSGTVLLEIEKPYSNHNGGALVFGADGMLYVSVGDGGGAGDPENNAQDKSVLLGKILRIDPKSKVPYGIPQDNPFVGESGARGEIWAYGLRNPWRMSFDRLTGELWLGDAGQSSWEEIDRVKKGDNLGWRVFEGRHPYANPEGLPASRFVAPFLEYPNDETGGHAVIGGAVYRGSRLSSLFGKYLYGDFVSGRIWAVDPKDSATLAQIATLEGVSAFGEDEAGELYLLSYADGRVMKFR
ncbi:MAG: PQQ-dependent sugar dehydrogenase [Oligoflexia bacterium]|nr:PQQ-dependent sugar dehydrogenase [Oligoflexia bacterium]